MGDALSADLTPRLARSFLEPERPWLLALDGRLHPRVNAALEPVGTFLQGLWVAGYTGWNKIKVSWNENVVNRSGRIPWDENRLTVLQRDALGNGRLTVVENWDKAAAKLVDAGERVSFTVEENSSRRLYLYNCGL